MHFRLLFLLQYLFLTIVGADDHRNDTTMMMMMSINEYDLQCLSELPIDQLLKIRRSLYSAAPQDDAAAARIGYSLIDSDNRTVSALPLRNDKIKYNKSKN